MSLKKKTIALFLMAFTILLIAPNMVNATTSTYSDTTQGIEWSYELDSNENVVILKCNTTFATSAVTIPATIEEKNVISIGDKAFYNCTWLSTVELPDSVTSIGDSAFSGCSGLTSATLSSNLTSIGDSAFSGCSGLESVNLSSNLTSIGSYAFSGCSSLISILIPNNVTSIGRGAFSKCRKLISVILPENLSKIEEWTFKECTNLEMIKIPNNVTTIAGEYPFGAFYGCENLRKILIPDKVATIGSDVFNGCSKLTIYGNDGHVSKEYAEEKGVNFDYIANWDKAESGADITKPTVKKIEVKQNSNINYDSNTNKYYALAGAKLVINVNFNEEITGTTSPTLTIKFGDGENIEITEGTFAGSVITYTYTIKDTDKGIMKAVDLLGGNVKDVAGNEAELSCTEVTYGYSNNLIYANGTATNSGDTNNPGETPKDENNQKPNTPDNTTAPGGLPHTGKVTLFSILVVTIVVGIASFIKTKKYKGI